MKLLLALLATLMISSTPCDEAIRPVTSRVKSLVIYYDSAQEHPWHSVIEVRPNEYLPEPCRADSLDELIAQMRKAMEAR